MTNNAAIVFDQGTNGLYAGNMSGTGTLAKQGAGTITIGGVNTLAGLTTISAGELQVNGSWAGPMLVQNGARLSGTGSVGSTTNQGTIAPGNSIGTMTVNGDHTQSSAGVYEVEINAAGQSDRINVSGAASLGGTVDVVAEPGTYSPGTTYTILAAAGSVSGAFDSLKHNLAGMTPVVVYDADQVWLVLYRSPNGFVDIAETANQRAVRAELDALNPLATGMWADVLDVLASLPPAEIRGALDQLGGDLHATAEAIELANASHVLNLVSDRIQILQEERARCRCGCGKPSWRGWMLGYGFDGEIDGDGNAPDVEYALSGTAFGIDREIDDFTDGGLFGAYAPGRATRLADELEAECYDVGGYVSRDFGSHYVLAIAAYEHSEFDTTRRIRFGNINEVARADYDGDGFASYVECGWWRELGLWRVQPLVGFQYVSFLQQGFTERDADVLNLTAGDRSTDSFRSVVGARLLRPLAGPGRGAATIEFSGRWTHECLGDEPRLTTGFAGAGGGTFSVAGAVGGRDVFVLGAGLRLRISRRADVFVGYDAEVGDNLTAHGGNGGLQLVW